MSTMLNQPARQPERPASLARRAARSTEVTHDGAALIVLSNLILTVALRRQEQ
jgi:hypothetical protein